MQGLARTKWEFMCWRYQLCTPFSTFDENFATIDLRISIQSPTYLHFTLLPMLVKAFPSVMLQEIHPQQIVPLLANLFTFWEELCDGMCRTKFNGSHFCYRFLSVFYPFLSVSICFYPFLSVLICFRLLREHTVLIKVCEILWRLNNFISKFFLLLNSYEQP